MTRSSSTTKSSATASTRASSKTRASRSRKASARTAATRKKSRKPRKRPSRLTLLDGYATAERGIRPFYLSMFRAYIQCLDLGKPPTYANLATMLKRSRQSVWELFQRYPGLRPWLDARCQQAQMAMLGSVLYRTGMLAMQGSDRHTELFLKHHAGAFARGERGDLEGPATFAAGQAVYNFLVPAPPTPQLGPEEGRGYLPPPSTADLLTVARQSTLPPIPAQVPVLATR